LDSIEAYLEVGQKRVFAGALAWPGWCRSGRDEHTALQALLDGGSRYEQALTSSGLRFVAPADLTAFVVVERLPGNATTDFGAPDAAPSQDALPLSEPELARCQAILKALWGAFDKSCHSAQGQELRKGPRGGGRDLDRIIEHVMGAEQVYLSALGWKYKPGNPQDQQASLSAVRQAILDGLAAAVQGKIPPYGPRGGERWTPRYFVRRVAWHVLDHAWEIEDRLQVNPT
jgi:hypothetical protein